MDVSATVNRFGGEHGIQTMEYTFGMGIVKILQTD